MQGNIHRFGFVSNAAQGVLNHRFAALYIQQRRCVHKQTIYEKLNIPPKPKKPLPAFFKFMALIRPTLIKEFPDLKATQLSKVAAERWQNAESTMKTKLMQQYHAETIQYNKTLLEYTNKLTPEQKSEIKRAKQYSLDLKEEKKSKKKSKELGKPKQPPSSFLRYLKSRSSEQTKYPSPREWVKAISQEWNALPPEKKAKLEEERKCDFEKWSLELREWEERMIKEGNLDVVRSRTLLPQPKTKVKK